MGPAVSEILQCAAFGVAFALVLEAAAHFLAAEGAARNDAPPKGEP